MTLQEIMTWLNNGLAVVIVVIGGWGIYRVTRWVGQEIVLPMRDASVAHLNKTNDCLEKMSSSTAALNETMAGLREQITTVCKHR